MQNNCIIEYDDLNSNLNLNLNNVENLIIKYKNTLQLGNCTFDRDSIMKLLEFLSSANFGSYCEYGCGFGLLFFITNEMFKDKISHGLCFDDFYSPIQQYCNINKKCKFIETLSFSDNCNHNCDLVFFNGAKVEENKKLMENSKILIFNKEHPDILQLFNVIKIKYRNDFDFTHCGKNYYVAVRK